MAIGPVQLIVLGFDHPDTGDYVTYESTYPDDLAHALEVIRDAP